jgi:hypothetical protein
MRHTCTFSVIALLALSSCAWGYGTSKSSTTKTKEKPVTITKPILSTPIVQPIDDNQTTAIINQPIIQETPVTNDDSFMHTIAARGTIGLSFNSYSTDENPDNFAIEGNTEITKNLDAGTLVANLALLYDTNDDNRRYLMLNEAYFKTKVDNSTFLIGRNIRNWGVMEAYSTSDVFNTKNYLSDSFDMSSKYGALNAEYTYAYDDTKVSLIAKFEENEQPYPASDNIYNYLPLPYDGELKTEKNNHRPTVYLKYSGTFNDALGADYSIVAQNGYDNKRYFDYADATQTSLEQHAYLVNKALFFGNITYENIIVKLEAAYTDVLNDTTISDYTQASVGLEYLPSQSINGAELRLLLEYYNYTYQDKDKLENQDFSEMFNNDLFVGIQSSFGDAGSSEIKGGVLYDFTNHEQTYVLNFGTRMKENYRLSMEWMVISPGDDPLTAIGQMGQFNQVTFRANYFF